MLSRKLLSLYLPPIYNNIYLLFLLKYNNDFNMIIGYANLTNGEGDITINGITDSSVAIVMLNYGLTAYPTRTKCTANNIHVIFSSSSLSGLVEIIVIYHILH